MHFRINFKILLTVFKILNRLAHPYLRKILNVHTPVKALKFMLKKIKVSEVYSDLAKCM